MVTGAVPSSETSHGELGSAAGSGEGRTRIELLGRPSIRHGDEPAKVRGHKVWGLLTYLLLSQAPVARREVADALFSEAEDPFRALRWNLTELRRALRLPELFSGSELRLELPEDVMVDIRILAAGTSSEAVSIAGIGRDLLEGIDFPGAPRFEVWLLNQRRRFKVLSESVLRELALGHLGTEDPERAIDEAVRLVALDPLNESSQAILIRSYAAAGDRAAASRQLAACVTLLREALGVEPGIQVLDAVREEGPARTWVPYGRPAALAQLEAGQAAIQGNALEAGLSCLVRASVEARSCGDLPLETDALAEIGSTLAHRFGAERHDEAATVLHQVIERSARLSDPDREAWACYELAWIEFLAARYERCTVWTQRALSLTEEDSLHAAVGYVRGKALSETGNYGTAVATLDDALQRADASAEPLRISSVLAALGRTLMLRGEEQRARVHLERAVEIVKTHRLLWYAPCVEAYLGELYRRSGETEAATQTLDHAIAVARENSDATGEALALHGRSLVDAASGEVDRAGRALRGAIRTLTVHPEYVWAHAWAIDALCEILVEHRPHQAPVWIEGLENLAGRTGMRELLVRSYSYRHALGDPDALPTALLLAQGIDNPCLHADLTARRDALRPAGRGSRA